MGPDSGVRDELPAYRSDEDTTQILMVDEGRAKPIATELKRDRCTVSMLAGPMIGSLFTLDEDELVFGRGEEANARIQDKGLLRRHARVVRTGEYFYIEDLGSTNGTFVNGERVRSRRRLAEGDRLQMGGTVLFRVHLQDEVEQEATRKLYESAVRDPLTQVYNRRYLDERLTAEFAYARRHLTPLSVLMADLDHFKRVNDTLGHLAGDAVLRVVAASLQRILRTEDLVARYGGEEFCVIARGIDARNASIVAERVRRTVEGLAIPWEGKTLRVTLSVGIATMDQSHPLGNAQELVAAADAALYRAKEQGRNCSAT